MEEKPLYGALTVYRERGAYLRRREQFEIAKKAYDEAFRTNPDDVRLLLGRSRVCADAVMPEQAMDDAKRALELAPDDMTAKNVEAQAMYAMSNFERSVVESYRGSRLRIRPPYFIEGIIQGLETIQACIGSQAGNVMVDFLPIIKRQEEKKPDDDELLFKKIPHVSRIPRTDVAHKLSRLEARKHLLLTRVLAMKYLGPMAYDKFFLEALSQDEKIISANKEGSEKLQKIIQESVESLRNRQNMLRTQRPYYTIKYSESSESSYLTKYKKESLEKECRINTRTAERFMSQIHKAMVQNRTNDLIKLATHLQQFIDSKTARTLPNIDLLTDRLYRAIGDAYLSQYRLSYRLSDRGNRRRIAFLMGLPVGRPRSFDSVIASYPQKFLDVNKEVEKLKDQIEVCQNGYMKCWLRYELANLLNKQKNYAFSKFHSKRCQQEAQRLNCPTWWLNGCFTIMSGDMQQGNINEVKIQVEEALKWTKMILDPRVETFLHACSQFVAEFVPDDESKAIAKREKEILKVMDPDTRVQTEVLFKRISNLPPGRRFTVLPIKRPIGKDKMPSERIAYLQPRLTVVPGHPKALRRLPKTLIPGYQVFEQ